MEGRAAGFELRPARTPGGAERAGPGDPANPGQGLRLQRSQGRKGQNQSSPKTLRVIREMFFYRLKEAPASKGQKKPAVPDPMTKSALASPKRLQLFPRKSSAPIPV